MVQRTFGRLTIVGKLGHTKDKVKCRCSCGNVGFWRLNALRSGNTKSCGCLLRDVMPRVNRARATHGHAPKTGESSEYRAWENMRQRCSNPRLRNFSRYGGRGIKVCARWRVFSAFLKDVGFRPSPRHSLERIDNNGDYKPGNVRWATPSEQARNRSNTVWIEALGERLTLAEWSARTGIHQTLIRYRIRAGWSTDEAVSVPPRKQKTCNRSASG